MTVTVNGESREIDPGTTVTTLLASMKLAPDKVAIELNRRLLKSDRYDHPLQPGDELEVVTFVGGG